MPEPDQPRALRSIGDALKPGGRAFLELVPEGPRTCLEDVIEARAARRAGRATSPAYRAPYAHFWPDAYRQLAEDAGLHAERIVSEQKRWDFGSREGFVAFARVTFVEWTQRLPEAERDHFIADVLDAYARLDGGGPDRPRVFVFYQMEVEMTRP